ncbi:3951_t:CDS:2 [Funneliformis geosporum]|uniref:3951_t:CDS:1 n=1 Tax=Funneliformis geosporum TaxID=1117311 RepID=A0A9W4T8B7_9GLOM|nr:3951_t:CDS:2 [Funneliformis geosporum]
MKKVSNKVLSGDEKTRTYANTITDDFSYVLMNNAIDDFNNPKKVDKTDASFVLTYERGQKITLVRTKTLKTLDISNNNFSELDLSENQKLEYLSLFSNEELDFDKINFGGSKKTLKEINFAFAFENKVKLEYPSWDVLGDEAKMEFRAEFPNKDYENVMKGKVVFI